MASESAGLLLYRYQNQQLQFLLGHPGGPFWQNKDAGCWSIPKGELKPGEDTLAAARREFEEEIGFSPAGPLFPLGSITQKSGKTVHAWACEGDWDPALIRSNTFSCEWPPRSGTYQEFPEIDRAEWFPFDQACEKINPAQIPLLRELQSRLAAK